MDHILNIIKNRNLRINESAPLHVTSNIILGSAENILKPLQNKIISNKNLDISLDILKKCYNISEAYGNKICNYIIENIIPGSNIQHLLYLQSENKIPEKMNSSIDDLKIACRIINNQNKIDKRFNFGKIIKEYSIKKDQSDTIFELCNMIDTYNMKPHIKMNIALENIYYSYYINNINISKNIIGECILEYFICRESSINDNIYKSYKQVLENNKIFSLSDFGKLGKFVNENSGELYKNKLNNILESINKDEKIINDNILNIHNESEFINILDNIEDILESHYLSDIDRGKLYYAIELVEKIYNIDPSFVNIEKEKRFDINDIDNCVKLTIDGIIEDEEPILEKEKYWNSDIYDKEALENAFKESTEFANSKDINDTLIKFKAEQEKSPSKFKNLLFKLHTRKPEDVIDELPNIMGVVRSVFIIGIATVTPLGPIFGGIAALIDWILQKHINSKQSEKLLNYLRNEKKNIKNKIEKTSDEKKKKELEDYIKCLDKCIDKVLDYADSLNNDDHTDYSDNDELDDFDFTFESAIVYIGTALEAANTSIDFIKNNDLNVLKEFINTNNISNLSDILKYSSIQNLYINEMNLDLNKEKDIKTSLKEGYTDFKFNLSSIIARGIADKTIENSINESFRLNTVKLALQNAKAKIKNLSQKEKSMWQTVDAYGNGLVKNIEKAMTSDRREAIIKGSIIPSLSKCIKGSIALAGIGVFFGPCPALIAAVGSFATSKVLNAKEKKLLYDEIETELHVVEKQIEIAQNDGDMNQYRFLLNYQKKLTREYQRIKYNMKAQARDIPKSAKPY